LFKCYFNAFESLATYACQQLPQYPLTPEVHFHWLAVNGLQPSIPQNPEVVVYDASADTTGLPREVAYFYTKLTRLVLSASSAEASGQSITEACALLRVDSGLQALVGYLSRFVFVQIRRNLKSTHVLQGLLQVIHSLVLNTHLNLESCLHQLLPSLLSCIVGAKIGDPSDASNSYPNVQFPVGCYSVWSELKPLHIRNFAAVVVQAVLARYGDTFPDLLPRVCKTYLQAAFTEQRDPAPSLPLCGAAAVRYGGIIGLGMLGERVVSEVLLPNINAILLNSGAVNTNKDKDESKVSDFTVEPQQLIGRKGGIPNTVLPRHRQLVISDGTACYDMCEEFLVVSIITWYIRRSMSVVPFMDFLGFLRSKIVVIPRGLELADHSSRFSSPSFPPRLERKRRREEPGLTAAAAAGSPEARRVDELGVDDAHGGGWDRFADRNLEHFVPHFVGKSVSLRYCTDLFI
jgi:hypothetical protein